MTKEAFFRPAKWIAAPACILLAIPFAVLLAVTPWHDMHLIYGDKEAIYVSIGYSLIALGLITLLGIPVAFWLSRSRNMLCHAISILVFASMLTPPLAMGILLISAYGPYGTIGELLTAMGTELNNNAAAFITAQIYGGLAYFILIARQSFDNVPSLLEEQAWVLGAGSWYTFSRVIIPAAASGLATAIALTWVRVIGEFGIVLVFAYFPQGIPVKLFINLQNEGVEATYTLLWALLITALPLPFACQAIFRKRSST